MTKKCSLKEKKMLIAQSQDPFINIRCQRQALLESGVTSSNVLFGGTICPDFGQYLKPHYSHFEFDKYKYDTATTTANIAI